MTFSNSYNLKKNFTDKKLKFLDPCSEWATLFNKKPCIEHLRRETLKEDLVEILSYQEPRSRVVRKYKHVTEPESSWEASEESSPSWTTTSTWMETKPTTSSKWMETEPTTVWKERTTTTTTTKKAAWQERKVHKNKNGKSKKHSKPAESNEFKKAIEYILAHNITGINGGNGSDYLM